MTKSKKELVPKLRFPGFKGEWEERRVDTVLTKTSNVVHVDPNHIYREIGIRSHGRGIFHKAKKKGRSLGNKRVFRVKEDLFVVNIVFAWEQAVAKTTKQEVGMIASHRFPMYQPISSLLDLDYILRFFLTNKGKHLLALASPGGAGRNKTLGQKAFNELKLSLPTLPEQQKIASFLSATDSWVENLRLQKKSLEEYKKGMMQKIFAQEIRFKQDDGTDYPEWEEKRLGEVLDYEQPSSYIVESTEYNDKYETPVLTAGKSFILGYTNETSGIFNNLPVIIFDDFTTATQFVNFSFKVKSSAMKILKPKSGVNVYFIYEAMQQLRFEVGGHGRHWISIFSHLNTSLPTYEEQQKIASFLESIDNLINLKQSQIEQAEMWKKGLKQGLFV